VFSPNNHPFPQLSREFFRIDSALWTVPDSVTGRVQDLNMIHRCTNCPRKTSASHSKNYASTAYSGSSPDIVTGRVQGPKLIPSCTSYCCTTPVPHNEIPEINAREGVANRPLDIKAPVEVGSFSDPEHSGHSTGYPGSMKYLQSWNIVPITPKQGKKTFIRA